MNHRNETHKVLQKYKTAAFLLCIVLFAYSLNTVSVGAQEKKPFINSGEILSELTFTSSISKSKEQINKELIEAVKTRGVEFVLLEEDEIPLRKAGANDLLIKAILENITAEFKEKFAEMLYSKFTIICFPDDSTDFIKINKEQIKAAREFLRIFRDSKEDKVLIDYFRENLPIMKKRLAELEKKQK